MSEINRSKIRFVAVLISINAAIFVASLGVLAVIMNVDISRLLTNSAGVLGTNDINGSSELEGDFLDEQLLLELARFDEPLFVLQEDGVNLKISRWLDYYDYELLLEVESVNVGQDLETQLAVGPGFETYHLRTELGSSELIRTAAGRDSELVYGVDLTEERIIGFSVGEEEILLVLEQLAESEDFRYQLVRLSLDLETEPQIEALELDNRVRLRQLIGEDLTVQGLELVTFSSGAEKCIQFWYQESGRLQSNAMAESVDDEKPEAGMDATSSCSSGVVPLPQVFKLESSVVGAAPESSPGSSTTFKTVEKLFRVSGAAEEDSGQSSRDLLYEGSLGADLSYLGGRLFLSVASDSDVEDQANLLLNIPADFDPENISQLELPPGSTDTAYEINFSDAGAERGFVLARNYSGSELTGAILAQFDFRRSDPVLVELGLPRCDSGISACNYSVLE